MRDTKGRPDESSYTVVVGVGQVLNRSKDLGDAIEPIQMMLKALYGPKRILEQDYWARLVLSE